MSNIAMIQSTRLFISYPNSQKAIKPYNKRHPTVQNADEPYLFTRKYINSMMGLVLPKFLITVLPRSHRRTLLIIRNQTMKLESLRILDLLRGRACMAVCVSVQRGVLGTVLVCGFGVWPGVHGVDVQEDVDDCEVGG